MKQTQYPFHRIYLIKVHVPTNRDPEHRDFFLAHGFEADPTALKITFASSGEMTYPSNSYEGFTVRLITLEETKTLSEISQYAANFMQHLKLNEK